jgi:hypothetical protein
MSASPCHDGRYTRILDLNCSNFQYNVEDEVQSMAWTHQGTAMANLTSKGSCRDGGCDA